MKAVEGIFNRKAAKEAGKLAKEQQKAGIQLANELDYEPMYASERVPTFQRSQSPIARSYLESVLAGNNPSSTFSGAPNAKLTKQRQQADQNRMFGTMDERVAAQRAMEQATPWKVTPPTRQVNPDRNMDQGAALWTAQNSELAGSGVTKRIHDAVNSTGGGLDKTQGKLKGNDWQSDLAAEGRAKGIQNLLQTDYKGDPNRLAADIQEAGGIEALFARIEAQDRQKKGR